MRRWRKKRLRGTEQAGRQRQQGQLVSSAEGAVAALQTRTK